MPSAAQAHQPSIVSSQSQWRAAAPGQPANERPEDPGRW